MSHSWATLAVGQGPSGLMVDVLLMIAAAGIVTLAFRRLKLSAIPAYLVAGVLLGPDVFGAVSDVERVNSISLLATTLLMFTIGLHLDISDMQGRIRAVFVIALGAAGIQTLLGAVGAGLMGFSPGTGAAIAIAISMSSTAAVLKLLQMRRELRQSHGRICLGVLLVQDLLVVVVLAVLPAMTGDGTGAEGPGGLRVFLDLAGRALIAILALALVVLVGRIALPRLMSAAVRLGGQELLLLLATTAGLAAAALTAVLGLSTELGAFVAGFLLAGTPFRHELSGQLAPMRDLFMAVFFVAVGLSVSVGAAFDWWWVIGLGVVGVIVLKMVAIGGLAFLMGAPIPVAIVVGFTLAQAGEFTLIVLHAAGDVGLVNDTAEAVCVGIVAVTLILTPGLIETGRDVARRAAHQRFLRAREGGSLQSEEGESSALPGARHVVIGGFGPVGRAIAQRVEAQGVPVTIVDLNPATIERQSELGRRVVFGDVSNPSVLESAGVDDAVAVILTIPDDAAMLRAVRAVRLMAPHAFVAVRAGLVSRGMMAKELGADYAVAEELAAAEALSQQVAKCLSERLTPKDASSA